MSKLIQPEVHMLFESSARLCTYDFKTLHRQRFSNILYVEAVSYLSLYQLQIHTFHEGTCILRNFKAILVYVKPHFSVKVTATWKKERKKKYFLFFLQYVCY